MLNYKKLSEILIDQKISSAKLSEILKDRGITLGKDTIDSYRKGTIKNPKIMVLEEIADICKCSILEFFDDAQKEKEKIVTIELKENFLKYLQIIREYSDYAPKTFKAVQMVNGYVGAGSTGDMTGEALDKIFVDKNTIEKKYREKELQCTTVLGDSMTPYVNDGDIVLFYPFKNGECASADGKYIISTANGKQVKNIKFMLNGNIRIISENPSYHSKDGYDEELDHDSQEYLNIVGKVVGRILKG